MIRNVNSLEQLVINSLASRVLLAADVISAVLESSTAASREALLRHLLD